MQLRSNVLTRPAWQRYLAAVGLTVLVVAGRLALNPWWGVQQNRHLVLLPTVMLAAWLGGFRPGVISAVVSTMALHLLWSKTPGAWHLPGPDVVLFLAFSLVICGVVSSLETARARADAATRSRERVLEIVAHDLRNPLTAITGTAGGIRRAVPSLGPRLERIESAAGRMDRLIGQLVDSTQLEHGRLSISARPERVVPLVQEALEQFATTARERGITLETSALCPAAVVNADRDRVMQVLGNLVGNALKFTPSGGRVAVSAAQRKNVVWFSVADTGPGIAPDALPHVFEQYWRQDERGTGLGLFIARSVVQAHGGRIWAQSQPGAGTTFYFTLPAAAPVPANSADDERRHAPDAACATPAGAFPPSPPDG
jgi:signal transduction histidine kinase